LTAARVGPNGHDRAGTRRACAARRREAIAAGQLLAPAKTLAEMTQVVINDYIDATLGVGRCCHGDLWPDRHLAGAEANAGHALIREQLVSVLAAWMKRVPG
jgi:hypothetical protein